MTLAFIYTIDTLAQTNSYTGEIISENNKEYLIVLKNINDSNDVYSVISKTIIDRKLTIENINSGEYERCIYDSDKSYVDCSIIVIPQENQDLIFIKDDLIPVVL